MALLTPGVVVSSDSNVATEIPTLSAAQAASKSVILAKAPTSPAKVVMSIVSGTSQINGPDFSVTGTLLSWNGLALETVLEENDTFVVQYVI